MNNSIFSSAIFKHSLRRLKLFGIISGLCIAVQSIIIPFLIFVMARDQLMKPGSSTELNFYEIQPLVWAMFLALPGLGMMLFDFMQKRNSSDFWHSMPVRRSAYFISSLLALFVWTASVILVSFAITAFSYALLPGVKISYTADISKEPLMPYILVGGLYLLSAWLVATNVAGSKTTVASAFIFILFFPRGIVLFVQIMISSVCGYVVRDGGGIISDNSYNLLWRLFGVLFNEELNSPLWASVVYTLILSVGLLFIAGILFVKRKSEKAESLAISPVVQRAISFVPPLAFAMIPTALLIISRYSPDEYYSGVNVLIASLYLLAVLIYVVYEIITTRSVRTIKKALTRIWIPAALVSVLIITTMVRIEMYRHQKPSAEEIDSISMSSLATMKNYEPAVIDALSKIEFDEPELKQLVSDALSNAIEDRTGSNHNYVLTIRYGGKTIKRYLYVPGDATWNIINKNEEVAKLFYDSLPTSSVDSISIHSANSSLEIKGWQIDPLLEAIEKDRAALTPSEWVLLAEPVNNTDHEKRSYHIAINFIPDENSDKKDVVIDRICSYCIYLEPELMPETAKVIQSVIH